jgi:Peptidase family M23
MRRVIPFITAFFLIGPQAQAAWVWPVSGDVITSYRNGTDPYATGQHRGIDIAAPVGAPVVAAAGGDVRFAGTAGSSGLTISIRTGDGYDTSYLHLSSLSVRAGAHVSAGDRIAAVGTTGIRSATAPHLHFGVRDAGTRHDYRDPLAFLPPAPPSPAPEPPAAAPAPATGPEPAPPAAVPVRSRPRPITVHRPAPARRTAPNPHPAREPEPAGTLVPRELPEAAPARHAAGRVPAHGRGGRPVIPPAHEQSPRHGRARLSRLDATRRPAQAGSSSETALSPVHAATPREAGGGPDIGWAAACAGLLLAAALLGLSGEPGDRGKWASAKLAAALRPLAGRSGSP